MVCSPATFRRSFFIKTIGLSHIDFASNDGLDSMSAGLDVKRYHTEQVAMFSHGYGVHVQVLDRLDQSRNRLSAVKETVIRMIV